MGLDARVLATTFPIAAVALIVAGGFFSHASLSDEVAACFVRNCFDTKIAERFTSTISPFLQGTKFEGKLNSAQPPKDGYMNIYFATLSLPGRLSSIACNCAYIGSSIIICDNRFLASFTSAVNFTRDSFYGENAGEIWDQETRIFSQVNERLARVLLSWLIGHEIGHAVLHDTVNFQRRHVITEPKELEADAFFIEKAFANADKQQRQELYSGITQFIFTIIGTAFRAGEGGTTTVGAAVVAPSIDDIHPPWVIRALKLGQRMADLDPDTPSHDDFYVSLLSHVRIEAGGTEIGSLCAFENLREIAARRQQQRLQDPSR
jgi:hypothetical protein